MPLLPALRLTGAQTLLDGALHDAPVTLDHGHIGEGPGREVDLRFPAAARHRRPAR